MNESQVRRIRSSVGSARARFGLTEGQAYTVVIVLVIVALLSSSLWRIRSTAEETSTPPGSSPVAAGPAPQPSPSASTPVDWLSVMSPPFRSEESPKAAASSGPSDPGDESTPPTTPPDAPPCAAEANVQQIRDALEAVDSMAGGVVPDRSVVAILSRITGCSETDPTILLIAALMEVGNSLPDPGLPQASVPLPPMEIPPEIIGLVRPLAPAISPACGAVSTVAAVGFLVLLQYPNPIPGVFTTVAFQALWVCGQLSPA